MNILGARGHVNRLGSLVGQLTGKGLTPFLYILLMVDVMRWTRMRIANDEALHRQAFRNDVTKIFDTVCLLCGGNVVLACHAAGD